MLFLMSFIVAFIPCDMAGVALAPGLLEFIAAPTAEPALEEYKIINYSIISYIMLALRLLIPGVSWMIFRTGIDSVVFTGITWLLLDFVWAPESKLLGKAWMIGREFVELTNFTVAIWVCLSFGLFACRRDTASRAFWSFASRSSDFLF